MSQAVDAYDDTTGNLSTEDYSTFFAEAEAYNKAIYELGSAAALVSPETIPGYENLLDVNGSGIMGYVTIDKIDEQLPIYHGTDAEVLAAGVGHLQGSSLPIGGENTHSVISAHRGMPSALLFTRLDELEEGDTFTITILDRLLTYEVDQIFIILPTEYEDLYIEEGKDLCTLLTCTPYGINTHRLLVRGVRTDNAADRHRVTADAVLINPIVTVPFVAAPLLGILFVGLLVRTRKRKSPRGKNA